MRWPDNTTDLWGLIKYLLVILATATVVVMPFYVWGEQFELMLSRDGAVRWLDEFGQFAWLAGIGLLVADLALPIPTTAVIAALGMLYGPVLGGSIGSLGSVASGLIGYGLCRHLGRPFALWLNGERALATGDRLFSRAGGWFVVLSRWLPVLSEVVACLAGLSRMSFTVFLAALLCGSVPLGFVFASIGHLGGEQPAATLVLSAVLPLCLWLALRPVLRHRMGDF